MTSAAARMRASAAPRSRVLGEDWVTRSRRGRAPSTVANAVRRAAGPARGRAVESGPSPMPPGAPPEPESRRIWRVRRGRRRWLAGLVAAVLVLGAAWTLRARLLAPLVAAKLRELGARELGG